MATVTCAACERTRDMPIARTGTARTPARWKVFQGRAYCPGCKQQALMVRAIILPIAGPEDGTWEQLRVALRTVWTETTRCANWMMTQLYLRDTRSLEFMDLPRTYLYPEARALFPDLPAQAVAVLSQRVLSLYRARRHDILSTGTQSLPLFRYPAPFSMPSQAWAIHETAGRWHVAIRLGDRRWTLRLRGGPQMRRQLARLKQLESEVAQRGDATLYEVPASAGDHRSGFSGRRSSRVMIKLAAWLPKPEPATGATLRLRTDKAALLAYDGTSWRIDATSMREILATDARRRSELPPASTHGVHLTSRQRARLRKVRADRRRRSHLRIADACRVYAAQAAAFAARQRAGVVEYTDAEQSALPHFPWEHLRRNIAAKLDERGIRFVHVNAMPAVLEEKTPAASASLQLS
jgi:hypothetical protein